MRYLQRNWRLHVSKEAETITQVMRVDDKDWFLQNLVNMVNSGGFSLDITLNVGGFLVSGQMIGGKAYFEGFGSDFASAIENPKIAASIEAAFAKNGEIYSLEGEMPPSPSYIHIMNARFFNTNGNPIPDNRGVWWRGRLSQVDGFSLGSLSAEGA